MGGRPTTLSPPPSSAAQVDTDEPAQGRGPSASIGADPPMSFVFVHSRSYRELQVECGERRAAAGLSRTSL